MPLYTYKCFDGCEKTQEVVHSANEEPTVKCPVCGMIMRRAILQAPVLHLSLMANGRRVRGGSITFDRGKFERLHGVTKAMQLEEDRVYEEDAIKDY